MARWPSRQATVKAVRPYGRVSGLALPARRRLPVRAHAKMRLPLTPMIDVTFQLLLFFLLATTFRQAEGQIPGALPQRTGTGALDPAIVRPIRIAIVPAGADGGAAYHLDGAAAPLADAQELHRQLASRRQAYGSGDVPVAIQPRWDVPWEHVVQAHNQALRAGFRSVGIVSSP